MVTKAVTFLVTNNSSFTGDVAMAIKLKNEVLEKDDPKRLMRSLKRHTLLLLQPLFIAVLITAFWTLIRGLGVHFPELDTDGLAVAIINTLAIMFSLIYAVILSTIWANFQKISTCIMTEDMETFLRYRDERIPIIMHLFLGAASAPIIIIIGLIEWHSYWSGFAGVFSVSFVISLFWVGAAELQDPQKSPWMAERIPEEWLKTNIDDRFYDEK